MRYVPLDDEKFQVLLRPDEHEQMIDSAPHHRAYLAFNLMSQSLRVGTVPDITPGNFVKHPEGFWLLHVETKDATNRDRETKPRSVWIPRPLMDSIRNRIERLDLADDDPLIDITSRQISDWTVTARENAARATGNDDYLKVTSHDSRRYYAAHYMYRLNVDPKAVRQMGGWKEVAHMEEYLLYTSDLISDGLVDAGLLGIDPQHLDGRSTEEQISQNFETIASLVASKDDENINDALHDGTRLLAEMCDSLDVTVYENFGNENAQTVLGSD